MKLTKGSVGGTPTAYLGSAQDPEPSAGLLGDLLGAQRVQRNGDLTKV